MFEYRLKQWIDFLLPKVFLVFAYLWCAQSIVTMIIAQSIFSPVHLLFTPITMHATTALNCTLIYLVSYHFYRTFQFGHQRVVRALLFTFVGVIFYDAVWASFNFQINNAAFPLLPWTSFAAIIVFMYLINKQQKIVTFDLKRTLLIVGLYALSLYLFAFQSHFFQMWGMYERGLLGDPTSYEWLFNKTVALWMWLVFAFK